MNTIVLPEKWAAAKLTLKELNEDTSGHTIGWYATREDTSETVEVATAPGTTMGGSVVFIADLAEKKISAGTWYFEFIADRDTAPIPIEIGTGQYMVKAIIKDLHAL